MKIILALLMPTIVFGFQDFTVSLHLPAFMTLEFLRARITPIPNILLEINMNIEIISCFDEMLISRFVHFSSLFRRILARPPPTLQQTTAVAT